MTTQATAEFEITGWDETASFELEGGRTLSRATVRKTFRGDLEGESTAELLMCQTDGAGRAYVAQEVVVGTLGGRKGTFVLQHGGAEGGVERRWFGFVVPGSASDELGGLSGEVEFQHDEQGAVLRLDYDLG